MITVVDGPKTSAFTSLARVKRELGIEESDTSRDEWLDDLIEEVSASIIAYCRQPFARQTVIEHQPGMGRTVQVMTVTPVPPGGLTDVRFDGEPVSDCFVSQPNAGFIFKPGGFANTRPVETWIEPEFAIMPGQPRYDFYYSGGYLMPGDDVIAPSGEATVSDDGYFELTGDEEFPILVSGESIVVTGFTNAENNGRHTVLSRTASRLYVASTLVEETSVSETNFLVRTLPRNLEAAALNEIRRRFYNASVNPAVTSEKLGDWSANYGGQAALGADTGGLLPSTAAMLATYVRLD